MTPVIPVCFRLHNVCMLVCTFVFTDVLIVLMYVNLCIYNAY